MHLLFIAILRQYSEPNIGFTSIAYYIFGIYLQGVEIILRVCVIFHTKLGSSCRETLSCF